MEWEDKLIKALEESISEVPEPAGVLFSGGLDSSLLAFLLHRIGKEIHLYSSCTSESHDAEWAPRAAELLGLRTDMIIKTDQQAIDGISELKARTGETNPLMLLIEIPLYFISQDASESLLLTGQGADELFLGYKKYEKDDTSRTDIRKVLDSVIPLEERIASLGGKKMIYPYVNEKIVELASNIPNDLKLRDGSRKYILRSAASKVNLSGEIAWKQKKAAQYSSGFKDAIERAARRRGRSLHEFISEL